VRRHPSLKLKAQTLSASREILLRLRRPKIFRSVALKLFSLSSVLILFAVYRKRLEAAPLLTTEQVEDSQIPFSGEETKLAAPGRSVHFISALSETLVFRESSSLNPIWKRPADAANRGTYGNIGFKTSPSATRPQ
jgi:hypothetical protein